MSLPTHASSTDPHDPTPFVVLGLVSLAERTLRTADIATGGAKAAPALEEEPFTLALLGAVSVALSVLRTARDLPHPHAGNTPVPPIFVESDLPLRGLLR